MEYREFLFRSVGSRLILISTTFYEKKKCSNFLPTRQNDTLQYSIFMYSFRWVYLMLLDRWAPKFVEVMTNKLHTTSDCL